MEGNENEDYVVWGADTKMTLKDLAEGLGVWSRICDTVAVICGRGAGMLLLDRLAIIAIRESRATRRLGSYVFHGKDPVCLRLQFAQETDCLTETFLHEVAHACDHLHGGHHRRCAPHGDGWKQWAQALGIPPRIRGTSPALAALHQDRRKLVAVCNSCGAEIHRLRRLNRRRSYLHTVCGGSLRLV